jgi:hypothetical protein
MVEALPIGGITSTPMTISGRMSAQDLIAKSENQRLSYQSGISAIAGGVQSLGRILPDR